MHFCGWASSVITVLFGWHCDFLLIICRTSPRPKSPWQYNLCTRCINWPWEDTGGGDQRDLSWGLLKALLSPQLWYVSLWQLHRKEKRGQMKTLVKKLWDNTCEHEFSTRKQMPVSIPLLICADFFAFSNAIHSGLVAILSQERGCRRWPTLVMGYIIQSTIEPWCWK